MLDGSEGATTAALASAGYVFFFSFFGEVRVD